MRLAIYSGQRHQLTNFRRNLFGSTEPRDASTLRGTLLFPSTHRLGFVSWTIRRLDVADPPPRAGPSRHAHRSSSAISTTCTPSFAGSLGRSPRTNPTWKNSLAKGPSSP